MKEPIFIVGVGRSGTSLLTSMINSHPNISIPGESWYFPLINNYLKVNKQKGKKSTIDEIIDLIEKRGTFSNLNVSRQELAHQLERTDFDKFSDVIASGHIALMRKESKSRWGDKTPGYLTQLEMLKELYPKAYIIHIIRDGRDVSLSMLTAIKKGQLEGANTLVEIAYIWRNNILIGRKTAKALFRNRYFEVKYENLLMNPEFELKNICHFIEEDFNEKMLNYKESAIKFFKPSERLFHAKLLTGIDSKNQNKWKLAMTVSQQILFSKIAGDLLDEYGYEKTKGISLKATIVIVLFHMRRFVDYIYIYSKKIKNRLRKMLKFR